MSRRPRLGLLAGVVALSVLASSVPPTAAAPNGEDWPRYETPEEAGFSSEALEEAEGYWQDLETAAVASFFLVYRGKVLAAFGSESYNYWCHSVRKSLLSVLYGIHVDKGNIDLESTVEELGIDDDPPLTREEGQAKVSDLIKARSGVFHEAACEVQSMRDERPERGSHPAGTFWYYNNWDFNALGSIFRQETGRDIFKEFKRRIARPVGMQDFQTSRCEYFEQRQFSIHPCYTFRMSARDRARFGQLILQRGRWGNRQIIPEAWIDESTRAYSETGIAPGLGYGYMWWILGPDFFELAYEDPRLHHLLGFAASGVAGQMILVLPAAEMVVVFAVDEPAGGRLGLAQSMEMLERVLTSKEIVDLKILRATAQQRIVSAGDPLRLVAKTKNRSQGRSLRTTVDFYLTPEGDTGDELLRIGSVALPEIRGNKKEAVRKTFTIPEDLAPGRYHLVSSVDAGMANYDLNRENNVSLSKRTLEIR